MKKTIEIKIKRFLELSKIFSKTEEDLFGSEEIEYLNINSTGNLSVSGNATLTSLYVNTPYSSLQIDGRNIVIGRDGILRAEDNKPLTRAEKIILDAKIEAKLSEDYDEYIVLQNNLQEYFKVVDKLNTN